MQHNKSAFWKKDFNGANIKSKNGKRVNKRFQEKTRAFKSMKRLFKNNPKKLLTVRP